MLRFVTSFVCIVSVAYGLLANAASAQQLSLLVNPTTGHVSIENQTSSAVDIDGYLLTASQSLFVTSNWTSLHDEPVVGWAETNFQPNRLGETNLTNSSSVAAGSSVKLGAIYTPFAPTQIGQPEPNFAFSYHQPGSSTVFGDIQFSPQNNIVLSIEPDGTAFLQNQSAFDVTIDGYLITSPSDALSPSTWTPGGLGSGWAATHAASNRVGETNLLGSLFLEALGEPIAIGKPIDMSMLDEASDVKLQYHVAGGSTIAGGVFLASSSVSADGDFDGDGDVDGRDFLVWQRGGTSPPLDGSDLSLWKSNYGPPIVSAINTVPEPSALALLTVWSMFWGVRGPSRKCVRTSESV